jgi:hypothetical protein
MAQSPEEAVNPPPPKVQGLQEGTVLAQQFGVVGDDHSRSRGPLGPSRSPYLSSVTGMSCKADLALSMKELRATKCG